MGVREGGMRPGGMWLGTPMGAQAQEMILGRLVEDPQFAEKLGLAPDQVDKLKKAHTDGQDQMTKLEADRKQAALKQAELMTATNVDEDAVMKAVEQTGAVQTQIAKIQVQQILALKKILTPDQLEKAKQLGRDRAREFREKAGNFRRQGPGAGGPGAPAGQPPATPPPPKEGP